MSAQTERMTKPTWAPEKNYDLDYEVIVRSWGYDVLSFDTCGSYQGDHCVLLADAKRRGFTMIGYGSCTGCDELEDIRPDSWRASDEQDDWTAVNELRDRLRNEVHWEPNSAALAAWLAARLVDQGKGSDWYWFDSDVQNVTRRYVHALRTNDHSRLVPNSDEG